VPNDIGVKCLTFIVIYISKHFIIKYISKYISKKWKHIYLAIAKKNSKKAANGGSNFGNIFPLAVLSLASCSPAELASFSDSTANIKKFDWINN